MKTAASFFSGTRASGAALLRLLLLGGLASLAAGAAFGQTGWDSYPPIAYGQAPPPVPVELVVPKGTPIRVALEKTLPIRRAGQPITARVMEPVYAFDRIVIPKGSELTGKIARLIPAPRLRRVEAIMNGNFSPQGSVQIEFDTLVLKDGTRRPLSTVVSPAILNVVRLGGPPDKKAGKVKQAKSEASREWHAAIAQVKAPGKLHRLKELALSELPYHRQSLAAGAAFDAELEQPLGFGTAEVSAEDLARLGEVPPEGCDVFARLVTPLSSATDRVGMPVEAVISRPLFSPRKQLLLPEGARLEGVVVRARRARNLKRNGQLRFVLQRVELPSGIEHRVNASVEGLEVSRNSNIKLDSEGGTSVATPRKRYLTTGLSVAIAAAASHPDAEHHTVDTAGDPGQRGLAGGSGFRLVGLLFSVAVQSRVFSSVMGFYGAGMSVYSHFLSRGQDVVLPKDTPMEIGFAAQDHPGKR